MVKSYPELIDKLNEFEEGLVEHGDITAAYVQLYDLSTDLIYYNISIYNTLDQNIVLKIGSNEITILTNTSRAFDNFPHNGILYIKAKSSLPSSGQLQVVSF